MYGELGLLMSSSFTFLWCYVTLPGLLTLIVIYLIQLYHKEPPNYIAWNSSSVRLPNPDLPLPLWGPFVRSPAPQDHRSVLLLSPGTI